MTIDTPLDPIEQLVGRIEPGPGHNRPPSEAELLKDRLKTTYADLLTRRDELVAAAAAADVEITDEDTAALAADFARQMAAAIKLTEGQHTVEKAPLLESSKIVDGFFKAIWEPLQVLRRKLLDERIGDYAARKAAAKRAELAEIARKAEEDRKRHEAAVLNAGPVSAVAGDALLDEAILARTRAQDAAAAVAEAKPSDLGKVRGNYGGGATIREEWTFTVTDRAKVDLEKLRPYLAAADVDKAIRGFIKAGHRQLAGVRIEQRNRIIGR